VQYVAKGTLTVTGDELTVVASDSATPETASAESSTLDAGTVFVVPTGGSVDLRNDGSEPATVFDLLTASDAAITDETDVARVVLAQQDYALPAGSVTITLSRVTIQPGEQFDWPADPAVTTLYPLDRSDAFLMTGQGFNRGTHPIEIYALTIAPATE
jgi:hypothetical protein